MAQIELSSCALLALCALTASCSMGSSGSDSSRGAPTAMGGSHNGAGSGGSSTASGGSNSGEPPPEVEQETRYLAPVTTGKYLWSANPLSGRVALIDASDLSVQLTTAGNRPTQVLGLDVGEERFGALVLNELSQDATLLWLDDAGVPRKAKSFRTQPNANSWALSPRSSYALAWTDFQKIDQVGPLDLFQDVTLITLDADAESAKRLSVGARPSRFVFDAREEHAYAVTEEGISVIELGASPSVSAVLAVSDEPLQVGVARDVSFAPDGSYALVRRDGSREISVISLPDGARESVDLGGFVSDLDLAPDASQALAVVNAAGADPRVVVVPLPIAQHTLADFPSVELTGARAGAVALNSDASAALVYSTVQQTSRVELLDLRRGPSFLSYRTQDLISEVSALFAAPDPRFAISFQVAPANSKKQGAFSLLSTSAARVPKIVGTDAALAQLAFAGNTALVSVRSDAQHSYGAYLIALENQQVDFVALQSPPIAAGVVSAAGRAFIAQSHPEGRITFVSLEDGQLQTLTGFELAARIRSQ